MNYRQNTLRAYRFQGPEWIPVFTGYPSMMWQHYAADDLQALMASHPILFPGYQPGDPREHRVETRPDRIAGEPYTDYWGCVWQTAYTGMVGHVNHHPLADWNHLAGFQPPDPQFNDGLLPLDWLQLETAAADCRKEDRLFNLYLPHGHTFLRLLDLRGYEAVMMDMADEEPRLWQVLQMLEDFNLELLNRFIRLKPDIIGVPEDLGMQDRLMISPRHYRKYIKPSYLKMTGLIKQNGILVHEHTDGYMMQIVDDLIEAGGDILNLQDLVNGIDNIARTLKGRLAIDLDIDRQSVTVRGTPKDIDDHIRECVVKLGSPQGGLSLLYQPWPETPLENMRAVFDALEKYCTFYHS
jgi:uroporphyrinogen decarboxylase